MFLCISCTQSSMPKRYQPCACYGAPLEHQRTVVCADPFYVQHTYFAHTGGAVYLTVSIFTITASCLTKTIWKNGPSPLEHQGTAFAPTPSMLPKRSSPVTCTLVRHGSWARGMLRIYDVTLKNKETRRACKILRIYISVLK